MSYQHPKNIFRIKKDEWLSVHENIFEPGNWERIEK
jgi:hypothetical protein